MALLKRFGVEIGDKGHSTEYPPTVIAEIAKELKRRVVQFVETSGDWPVPFTITADKDTSKKRKR